jgi:DNA topoisomerase III
MKVCIAEKPSVAKDIAEVLGAKQRKDGYYEGAGYQVTWTFGHFCTLKEPEDYQPAWKFWRLEDLPMIPDSFGIKLINNDGVKKQFTVIENLIRNCEEVINCGDAGQEGELIQRWVLLKAKCNKPVKRLWISSLTEQAIREGFQKLKDSDPRHWRLAAGYECHPALYQKVCPAESGAFHRAGANTHPGHDRTKAKRNQCLCCRRVLGVEDSVPRYGVRGNN